MYTASSHYVTMRWLNDTGAFETASPASLPFGTDMYYMEVFEVARASSLPFGVASFCRMKRVSVETSDAVRSTVPPELVIPHVSAGLVTLRVPDPSPVSFRTTDLVLSRMSRS